MVSVVLVVWFLSRANLSEIGASMQSAAPATLALALCLPIIGVMISITRWKLLLQMQGNVYRFWPVAQSYLVGGFFNNFLPSTYGGDAMRAYEAYRLGTSKSGAVVSVVADRVMGLVVLMVLALGAMLLPSPLTAELPPLHLWAGLGIVATVVGCVVVIRPPHFLKRLAQQIAPRLPDKLCRLVVAVHDMGKRPRILAQTMGLSLLLQLNAITYYYLIGKALGLPVPFSSFLLIVPLTLFIMAIPISINAIGIRENVFAWFLLPFGVSHTLALAFVLISYSGMIMQGVVGGLIYMLRKR